MFERLNMVRYIFLAKNKQGQSVFYGIGSIRNTANTAKSIITRFRRITGDSRIL